MLLGLVIIGQCLLVAGRWVNLLHFYAVMFFHLIFCPHHFSTQTDAPDFKFLIITPHFHGYSNNEQIIQWAKHIYFIKE